MSLTAICIVLTITFTAEGQASQEPSRTWAVAVGISKYAKLPGGQQLQFADKDATAFATALEKSGVQSENIRLLTGTDATAAAIKSAIGLWVAQRAKLTDTVIFFFSGHGLLETGFGEAYLLGYDADPNNIYGTALSVSDLTHALSKRVRAENVLVIADAVRRDFFDPDADGDHAATSFVQALARLSASRPGASAILASGPGEFSREGQRWGGHGVFTRHLLDILSGNPDADGDGSITAEEVYTILTRKVAEDTSNKQHPWRSQSALSQIALARAATRPTNVAVQIQRDSPAVVSPTKTETAASPPVKAQPSESLPAPPQREQEQAATVPTVAPPRPKRDNPPPVKTRGDKKTAAPVTVEPVAPTVIAPSGRQPVPEQPVITPPKPKAKVPPPTRRVPETRTTNETLIATANTRLETAEATPPPKPVSTPPSVPAVSGTPARGRDASAGGAVPVGTPGTAPSPLLLQFEAALGSGNLVEPKNASAWDIYQKLSQEPAAAGELSRLKPLLADALAQSGRALISGDIRADNVADKVEEFRKAGQLFSRARSLRPENAEVTTLEKLSAAQALVALQFYDEAERSLAQLQSAKLAAVENCLGLAYLGKLDYWQAERAFKRAIEMSPEWAAPHYNLALLYRASKNADPLPAFERAVALDSTNVATLTALGDEYFGKEQWQKAAEAYRKAVALRPDDDALRTKLGHALYSLGLRDEANSEYQKANQLRGRRP